MLKAVQVGQGPAEPRALLWLSLCLPCCADQPLAAFMPEGLGPCPSPGCSCSTSQGFGSPRSPRVAEEEEGLYLSLPPGTGAAI